MPTLISEQISVEFVDEASSVFWWQCGARMLVRRHLAGPSIELVPLPAR